MRPDSPAPQTAEDLVRLGRDALRQNRLSDARAAFEQALTLDKDCLAAHQKLSGLRFPGEDYYGLLGRLHHVLRPKTYVEIGVETGASMALALPGTKCVGIDPEPQITVKGPVEAKIFALRSSEFFANHDLTSILDGEPVELGFIDGLHVFESSLADFLNLERFCSPRGTLLIHDCLPLNETTAARKRQTRFWTGDVWRMLPTLARFRPELSLAVVACKPSGLAIIRGLNPRSSFSAQEYAEAVAFGLSLKFEETHALQTYGIKLISNDWDEIARALA
ncbi:MAG: hypothetical protein JWL86_5453 [Rhizobium sp.]|nr:hypothetical protein [Rhizobium sp.]